MIDVTSLGRRYITRKTGSRTRTRHHDVIILAVVRAALVSASALISAQASARSIIIIIFNCCDKFCFGHVLSDTSKRTLPISQTLSRPHQNTTVSIDSDHLQMIILDKPNHL